MVGSLSMDIWSCTRYPRYVRAVVMLGGVQISVVAIAGGVEAVVAGGGDLAESRNRHSILQIFILTEILHSLLSTDVPNPNITVRLDWAGAPASCETSKV